MQMLNIELNEGEVVTAEPGRMVYMTDNIKMDTNLEGGLFGFLKRSIIGESMFLVHFRSEAGTGIVAFGPEVPGKIVPIELSGGREVIAQKEAFLCMSKGVEFDPTFTRDLGGGFLGAEGLLLIKAKGNGYIFFNVGGEVTKIHLAEGQKLRVDPRSIAMFDSTVNYSVERIKGIKNMLFGGENLFLATLTGPGDVWVQSITVGELAMKLYHFMPHPRSASKSVGSTVANTALGALFRRSV